MFKELVAVRIKNGWVGEIFIVFYYTYAFMPKRGKCPSLVLLCLIFTYDLPDVIGSNLVVYADGATIYSCLGSKAYLSKVKITTDLQNDPS